MLERWFRSAMIRLWLLFGSEACFTLELDCQFSCFSDG